MPFPNPVSLPSFGTFVRELREHSDPPLTQAQAAGRLSEELAKLNPRFRLTQGMLSDLERGREEDPHPDLVRAMAAVFGVNRKDIIERLVTEKYSMA